MSATPEREQAEALMSELRFRCGGGNAEVIDALAAAVSRLVERAEKAERFAEHWKCVADEAERNAEETP